METHYEYTGGRLSRVTNSGENHEGALKSLDITYYAEGNYAGMVKTVENAIGVQSTYTYDFTNHTTTISDSNTKESDIRKIRYTYNDSLALTKAEDLKLATANQQVSETGYGNTSSTNTDPDRPLSSKDQYGNITSYEYDDNGNLTKTTYPDGSIETATYDEETNDVLTSTDRNGLLTENTYADGLLIQVKTGGLVTAAYSYYPKTTYGIEGLVKQETDAHGNITEYEYDTKGNVTKTKQIIDGVSHDTTNTYDNKGQLTKTVDPEGVKTEYIYNEAGAVLLTKVQDKNSSAGLTNMGALKVPEDMKPYIERFDIYMGQPFSSRTNCAIISFENILTINFASSIVETDVECNFFRKLVQDGIHVKVESNREIRY